MSHAELFPQGGWESFAGRVARLRDKSWVIGQCAVAAGLAWLVAADLLHHHQPFFAPIAAVVSLGTSYGQRLRRVAEVTVGVAVGVLLGDLITHVIGPGTLTIVLIVAIGMSVALLLDAGQLLMTQAAVQGIVVATLMPAQGGGAFLRWTDAVVGGVVALLAAMVVPRAPLRRPRERAAAVLRTIAGLLRSSASAMKDGNSEESLLLLRKARSTEPLITELRAASAEGLSVVSSSPFKWGHGDDQRQLADLVEPLDIALRDTRVLVRRVAVASYRRIAIPPAYAALTADLAAAVDQIADELQQGRRADAVIDELVALGRDTSTVEHSDELNSQALLAQIRSLISDLLALCGMDPLDATDALPLRPQ